MEFKKLRSLTEGVSFLILRWVYLLTVYKMLFLLRAILLLILLNWEVILISAVSVLLDII